MSQIDAPHVALRRQARQAEKQAADRAIGRSGSQRREIFELVRGAGPRGMTSREIAGYLGRLDPCRTCGCTHRPPIPTNQIGTRLGELREWGYLIHEVDDDLQPLVRDGAEVHVLTAKGKDAQ